MYHQSENVWFHQTSIHADQRITMKKITLPALAIILVTIILLIINEYTAWTWISDYALILIIAGMFLGVWLVKRWLSSKDE